MAVLDHRTILHQHIPWMVTLPGINAGGAGDVIGNSLIDDVSGAALQGRIHRVVLECSKHLVRAISVESEIVDTILSFREHSYTIRHGLLVIQSLAEGEGAP